MKRPAGSKNPERKSSNGVAKAIGKGVKAVGGYLNKVSGAAMFDKGGKHGPKYDNGAMKGSMKKKLSPKSTKKTVRKPKNKF